VSFEIYVSKKTQTIIELKKELNKEGNYITEKFGKSSIRKRFLQFVYCIDCGDIQCTFGEIDLGYNIPTVKCDNCGFIYHDNSESRLLTSKAKVLK
jgi:ribosomal protein S27E